MTAAGWLAVAGATALLAPPVRHDSRLARLAGGGRLGAGAGDPRSGTGFRPRWVAACAVVLVAGVAVLAGPALGVAAGGCAFAAWRMLRGLAATRAAKRADAERVIPPMSAAES